ncbi:PKD domain-containing protein [Alteromonas sp. H39]|uniref:PKD domain-containing protein n=1 Tax=Alteromonas sp. H39 TaxID=3389876 RepID=UPI0039DFF7C1
MKQWIAPTLLLLSLVGCGGGGGGSDSSGGNGGNGGTPTPPPSESNTPPTINGLSDISLSENSSGNFSPTVDSESNIDDFSWTQVSGPEMQISPSDMNLGFMTPEVGPEGDVAVFRFTVSASNGQTTNKDVSLNIENVNKLPVIQGVEAQDSIIGEVIEFDASSSFDPDGEIVTWNWTIDTPSSSSASLSTSDAAKTEFTPDVEGTYEVTVRVTDDLGGSSETVRTIEVSASNTPPVADAGRDANILTAHTYQLNGSNSYDEEMGELTYSWTLTVPADSATVLANANNMFASFTPDIPGTYSATLTVTDEGGLTDSDTVEITADNENLPPVAAPSANQTGKVGDVITIDGSASYDPEDEALDYLWSLSPPDGSTVVLDDNASASTTFTPDVEGEYLVTLVVNDGVFDSEPETTTVTIEIGNSAPVANAGENQLGEISETYTLDGSASTDPDGDMLTYQWTLSSQPEGSQANLSNDTLEQATFTADKSGDYVFYLEVSDGELTSTDVTTITLSHPQIKFWVLKNGERNNQLLANGFTGTYIGVALEDDFETGDFELEVTGAPITVEVESYDENNVVDPYFNGLPDGTSTIEAGEVVRFSLVFPGSLEGSQFLRFKIYIPEHDYTVMWEASRSLP